MVAKNRITLEFLQDKKLLTFKEDSHQYFYKGKELTSVSKFLEKFKPKFDPNGEILIKCAKRKGISPEELQKKWWAKRDDACDKGTKFHKDIEEFFKTGKIPNTENESLIKKFKKQFRPKGKVFSEVQIYDADLGIAGTTDLLEVFPDNTIICRDYKTNAKLSDYDYGQKMLPPIDTMGNGKIQFYELQLSCYVYLLCRRYDYWPTDKNCLFWIRKLKTKEEIVEIPIKYRPKEIEMLLKYDGRL